MFSLGSSDGQVRARLGRMFACERQLVARHAHAGRLEDFQSACLPPALNG
jgi:hypothetical protein